MQSGGPYARWRVGRVHTITSVGFVDVVTTFRGSGPLILVTSSTKRRGVNKGDGGAAHKARRDSFAVVTPVTCVGFAHAATMSQAE